MLYNWRFTFLLCHLIYHFLWTNQSSVLSSDIPLLTYCFDSPPHHWQQSCHTRCSSTKALWGMDRSLSVCVCLGGSFQKTLRTRGSVNAHRRSNSYKRQCDNAHLKNTAGQRLMMVSDHIKVCACSIISERGENHKRTDRWSVFMLNQIEGLSSATRSAINPLGRLSNQKC